MSQVDTTWTAVHTTKVLTKVFDPDDDDEKGQQRRHARYTKGVCIFRSQKPRSFCIRMSPPV